MTAMFSTTLRKKLQQQPLTTKGLSEAVRDLNWIAEQIEEAVTYSSHVTDEEAVICVEAVEEIQRKIQLLQQFPNWDDAKNNEKKADDKVLQRDKSQVEVNKLMNGIVLLHAKLLVASNNACKSVFCMPMIKEYYDKMKEEYENVVNSVKQTNLFIFAYTVKEEDASSQAAENSTKVESNIVRRLDWCRSHLKIIFSNALEQLNESLDNNKSNKIEEPAEIKDNDGRYFINFISQIYNIEMTLDLFASKLHKMMAVENGAKNAPMENE